MPVKRPGVKPTEKDKTGLETVVKQLRKNIKYPEDTDYGNMILKEVQNAEIS